MRVLLYEISQATVNRQTRRFPVQALIGMIIADLFSMPKSGSQTYEGGMIISRMFP